MNTFLFYLKSVCLLFFCLLPNLFASSPESIEKNAELTIEKLYHSLNFLHKPSMEDRIDWISAQFIGKPYLLGALGEGQDARFDQFPRYRTNAFDCETYVTTVLALALANNSNAFKQCLNQIRYKNGRRDYIERNHFTSLDWNQNNQKKGFLIDITGNIKNKNKQAIAKIAKAVINKPAWYQYKTKKSIRLYASSEEKQKKRLQELKSKGKTLDIQPSKLLYLPTSELFNGSGQPRQYLFDQIPHGAIIEIVRPNWDLRSKIGTCLNISHIGFAIRHQGILYYREASSSEGKIVDIPLTSYLRQTLKSPTIKGINVQIVKPERPLEAGCII